MAEKAAIIAALNDDFRKDLNKPSNPSDRIMLTHGVNALGFEFVQKALTAVMTFNDFSEDNDPHREHDFGKIDLLDHTLFWKIDYYAPDMEHGSEDPSNASETVRVLTIMLASEY